MIMTMEQRRARVEQWDAAAKARREQEQREKWAAGRDARFRSNVTLLGREMAERIQAQEDAGK